MYQKYPLRPHYFLRIEIVLWRPKSRLIEDNQPKPVQDLRNKELDKNNSAGGGIFFHPSEHNTTTAVKEGLDFMLEHFSEPLFPRKISRTAVDRRQYEVEDKDTALYYYKAALYEDCRISAFGVNQRNPDLIFIELDASDFGNMRSLKLALTATLKNIGNKLNGARPTVLWSGRGYHIIQPIHCPQPLEEIKEFAMLEPEDASTRFLQFAERYLSLNKCDKSHHPAIKSCMLRIPHSINSKCKAVGLDPDVKIIQKWDGHRPDYRLLIGSFYADLIEQQQRRWKEKDDYNGLSSPNELKTIAWVESLLQTPIADYRKHAANLIIIPYLVVYRGMTDREEIHDIVMQWADKCAELQRLDPSRREFAVRIRSRIDEVMRDRIPPMTFETLKEKNRELHEALNRENVRRYEQIRRPNLLTLGLAYLS